MRHDRRVLVCAVGVAALCLHVVLGHDELLLHFAPLVVLAALLLKGCYVGEARIVAARQRALPRPRARRRAPQRWRPAAERAPRSVLLRSARVVRGPPACARAAA